MTTLLDNISAMIIGMAVLAMVVVVQQRAQEAGVQRTLTYHAKKQTIELGRWLQDDLANVGAGVSFGSIAVTGRTVSGNGLTTSFEFLRKLEENDPQPVAIEYSLRPTDSLVVDGEEVQLYQLERRVGGDVVGSSPETLTAFRITMLDGNGLATVIPAEARQLRIEISNSLPYGDQRTAYLRETHWGTTVPLREL